MISKEHSNKFTFTEGGGGRGGRRQGEGGGNENENENENKNKNKNKSGWGMRLENKEQQVFLFWHLCSLQSYLLTLSSPVSSQHPEYLSDICHSLSPLLI